MLTKLEDRRPVGGVETVGAVIISDAENIEAKLGESEVFKVVMGDMEGSMVRCLCALKIIIVFFFFFF